MKNLTHLKSPFILGSVLVFSLSIYLFKAPLPLPADAPAYEFSAHRAFEHIKIIAQQPHSMATPEHAKVRDYIIAELQKQGLQTSVQSTTAIYDFRGVSAGYVHNVVGMVKGSTDGKSVVVMGHYDTKLHTPGAADDGSAVAGMLEAARTMSTQPQPMNDIIFLFTDGEESGLFGAKAFIDEHPLAKNVGIVLNVEARGSQGPSITFEVSPDNGWIMHEYAKCVPYPVAHSIAYEVYKLLPNDSDFTIFRQAGIPGFNIGFLGDFVNYHAMTDTPENLSLSSLQHHGSYIVSIAQHFGNIDLTNTLSDDVVYFNWIGTSLIVYPARLNTLLAVVVSLLLAGVIFLGIRQKRLSLGKTMAGLLLYVLALVLIIAFSILLKSGVKAAYPHYAVFYSSNFYNIHYYFIAFTSFALAIFAGFYALLLNKFGWENLLVGALLVSYGLLFALLLLIPSGAYLVIVPLVLILSGLLVGFLFKYSLQVKPIRFQLIQLIFSIPVTSLLIPLAIMLFITFGLDTIFGGIAVLVLLMGYLLIFTKILSAWNRWYLPAASLAFGLLFLLVGHLTSGYSKSQPLHSNVSYLYNADTQEAFWVSSVLRTDAWNRQFFAEAKRESLTGIYPNSGRTQLVAPAPRVSLSEPQLRVISDSAENGNRKMELHYATTRRAEFCRFYVDKEAKLISLTINGKPLTRQDFFTDSSATHYSLSYFGIYDVGVNLQLEVEGRAKVKFSVVEMKIGIPEVGGYKPMPDFIIPDKGYDSNVTVVKKSWEL